jgi:hypothetical protein
MAVPSQRRAFYASLLGPSSPSVLESRGGACFGFAAGEELTRVVRSELDHHASTRRQPVAELYWNRSPT